MRVWNLDDCDDSDCDIKVYLPGPAGPADGMTDVGTILLPALIVGAITGPLYSRQRSFIKGNGPGPVTNPTLPNGTNSPTAVMEWVLFATDSTNTVTLNNASNLKLSGQWIGGAGSILCLHWDNNSQWVEAYRNEI